MPELPEVETTIRFLLPKLKGKIFKDVWTDSYSLIKKPGSFDFFKEEIRGKKILDIWRKGKNIIFDLSQNYCLLIHQKLTGHLLVGKWEKKGREWIPLVKGALEEPINRYIHLIFYFKDGLMMALSDLRKFAKVELWKKEDLLNSKEFNKIGPDLLNPEFTFEEFKRILKGKKGKIKEVLMDQSVVSGIGNIYSSEALWEAKIHPLRKIEDLDEKELENLCNAIKKVLKLGIKLGGESFSDYRKPDGTKGSFDKARKVYQREGEKCYRCNNKIKRLKIGQRSAFYCPFCQKL